MNEVKLKIKFVVKIRKSELENCLIEAEEMIFDLKRKIRLAGLKEKKRVKKTKKLNKDFENSVKQVDLRTINSKYLIFTDVSKI